MAQSEEKVVDSVVNNNKELIQCVLGVHCAAYDMQAVPDEPYCVDIPISAHVVRWNIKTKHRVHTFRLHAGLISSIQAYSNAKTKQYFTATCGYDGMLRIWDKDYNLLCETIATTSSLVARIAWSGDGKQIVIQIKANESTFKGCTISLYNLNYDEQSKVYSLQLLKKKVDNYRYAVFNQYNQVLAVNTDPNTIELLSKDNLQFIGSFTHSVKQTWCVAMSMNRKGTKLAIATTSKEILIIDACSLQLLNTIKHKELSPNLWCVIWSKHNDDEEIIFSPKNGQIEIWNVVKSECKYRCPAPSDFIYVLQETTLNDDDDYLWFASSDSIFLQCINAPNTNVSEEKQNELSRKLYIENITKSRLCLQYHTITCCGVDLSFDAKDGNAPYVAVGDLGCSLYVWSLNKATTYNGYNPLVRKACPMSVRSVKWIPNTNVIFVGCLDGSLCLYRFDADSKGEEMLPAVYNCNNSGVTCIEYKYQYIASCKQVYMDPNEQDIVISAGTNSGEIFVLQFNCKSNKVELVKQFLAHPPVQSNDKKYKEKFGSIHKAADIWTCIWSPCGRYLATASEDQSTKIWDGDKDFKYMHTLKGHSTAVTCVDWTYLNDGKRELFATCADDRTVMIWSPVRNGKNESLEWNLLHVFSPSNVLGWFTFTYLRFVRDGNRLICGTENGYICIFDMDEMKNLYTKCVHRGSIEGLECDRTGLSVSVASDCTIVVTQMNSLNVAAKSLL